MHSPSLFLTTLLCFYSFSRSPSSAPPSSPPLLAPSIGPPLSSLLTFSLSCPPSVTVIRGDRGDQRRRRRTSSTDLSPPSPSFSLLLPLPSLPPSSCRVAPSLPFHVFCLPISRLSEDLLSFLSPFASPRHVEQFLKGHHFQFLLEYEPAAFLFT